ncbi:glutamine--fructose-6-phosphate aminotransferase, partial [candidate division KSB1 bacterium 4484_87]
MCGIVGYIGNQDAVPILLNGLKRLEYRGYDSAGISTIRKGQLEICKQKGKIQELEKKMCGVNLSSNIGIAHTRWATHGEPNVVNAHPHTDCTGKIALIHNGIIENYSAIKKDLESRGHVFKTETDTEVLAHLIEEQYKECKNLEKSVRLALSLVQGTYGIAVISSDEPDVLISARKGSPIVIGVGDGEYFLASDAAAIVGHTSQVIYLDDQELAIISKENVSIKTIDDQPVEKKISRIAFDVSLIEKSGYPHFMLKEIMEQPQTIYDSMRGRLLEDEGTVRLGGIENEVASLLHARRMLFTACGTSWHAALLGEYMLEEYVRIPV